MHASKHRNSAVDDNREVEAVFGYFRDTSDAILPEANSAPSTKNEDPPFSHRGILPPVGMAFFLRQLWTESIWPGMGLFGESYLLFSIGILTPLWKELYPDCWANHDDTVSETHDYDDYDYSDYETENDQSNTCSLRLLESLTYGVVLGVIAGMVLLGYWSNHIGRRKGSILTASLMAGGSLGLVTLATFFVERWSAEQIFRGTVGCLVLFGIGVGGEYPLSASLASEKATEELFKNRYLLAEKEHIVLTPQKGSEDISIQQHLHAVEAPTTRREDPQSEKGNRGRRVQLVFAMQGMGIWFNSLTMLLLLCVLTGGSYDYDDDDDEGGNVAYNDESLLLVWRITYAVGALILCFVLLTRIIYLEESKVWIDANKTNVFGGSNGGSDSKGNGGLMETSSSGQAGPKSSFLLVHRHYGSRMFGAGMAWLLWDISFYGNKLFQSTFLLAVVGDKASLTQLTGAAALNSTVALLGYYGAAMLIDLPPHPNLWIGGRKNLQSLGLIITGILFFACGLLASVSSTSTGPMMVAMYLVSSFVGQLGPNCTTFLIPAEIVPTEQRTYCHGVCAASGKVGALIAAVVFHFVGGSGGAILFYLCGGTGILGALVTHVFVPETSGLDLLELDLQWNIILRSEGRNEERDCYDGPAVHPNHLSPYERYRIRRRNHTAIGANKQTDGYYS